MTTFTALLPIFDLYSFAMVIIAAAIGFTATKDLVEYIQIRTKYPHGVFRCGDMSRAPMRLKISDAKETIWLQEENDRGEAGVFHRLAKSEQKAAHLDEAMWRDSWKTVTEMNCRDGQARELKIRERLMYRTRKRQAAEASKRLNCDHASGSER